MILTFDLFSMILTFDIFSSKVGGLKYSQWPGLKVVDVEYWSLKWADFRVSSFPLCIDAGAAGDEWGACDCDVRKLDGDDGFPRLAADTTQK